MTNKERLAHPCPECSAKAGDPCVYYTGKPTARPHKTRGPGQLEAHLQAEIDRKVAREKASYGPLFQEIAEAEVVAPTVPDVKERKRREAAFGVESDSLCQQANRGLEWIRLHYLRRLVAERVGEWWGEQLWGYARRVYETKESYIVGFLRDCLTTTADHRIRVVRLNDPSRVKVTKWKNANGIVIEFRHNGDYLHDTLVWPPYAIPLPVMTREAFDQLAPIDHRHGLKDAPELDDAGLFDRTVGRLARREAA